MPAGTPCDIELDTNINISQRICSLFTIMSVRVKEKNAF